MANTKNQRITIIVGQEYRAIIEAKAKSAQLNISAYVRRCLEYYDDKSTKDPTNILQERIASQDHQLTVKDEQQANKTNRTIKSRVNKYSKHHRNADKNIVHLCAHMKGQHIPVNQFTLPVFPASLAQDFFN